MENRCEWAGVVPNILFQYHDEEWGVPVHDDRVLFEFLILEGMQAGLSWITILKKRENMRKAFSDFIPQKIALYDSLYIEKLLQNEGIIRHRLKVNSLVINAKAFLEVQKEFGSFDAYIWSFVNHKPIQNRWVSMSDLPASTPLSDTISKNLKKRGFKFIGTTICYAFMQAVGMVNDHVVACPRYVEILELGKCS